MTKQRNENSARLTYYQESPSTNPQFAHFDWDFIAVHFLSLKSHCQKHTR